MKQIRLVFDDNEGDPLLDTALSHAVLRQVASGSAPETLRIHRPGRIVAFGRHDTVSAGYRDAVGVATAHGYTPIERLAGGRAAVFHEGTIAFAWAAPATDPKTGITGRFDTISGAVQAALTCLGVDARVGEVPGEYCPGAYSVNASGVKKLMGVGQRLTAGASHVGGVIVAEGEEMTRQILEPVYSALGLGWDPATVGAVESFTAVGWEAVAQAVIEQFESVVDLVPADFTDEERSLAASLAAGHVAGSQAPPA